MKVDPTHTAIPSPSMPETLETTSPSPTPVLYPDIPDLQFADLADLVFIFTSGAGAWDTEVRIMPDGTFSGIFHDSDMGDIGPDYPNGTRYICSFSGIFTSLKKTGDYEYSMKCESITQEGTADDVEIGDDGVRYITSDPYGFDNADEFVLYLPGKNIDELPEEYRQWLHLPSGVDYKGDDVLSFYGLYNVEGKQGFGCY
jgi:hypothetical protein